MKNIKVDFIIFIHDLKLFSFPKERWELGTKYSFAFSDVP